MTVRGRLWHAVVVTDTPRRGRPRTGKRSDAAYVPMTVLIREDLRRALKSRAALEGRDMSDVIEEVVQEYIKRTS